VSVGAMRSDGAEPQPPEFCDARLRYSEDLQLIGVDYDTALF
jgi:hypothetical protein